MDLILDTNAFYHLANIDSKDFVNQAEFDNVIASSKSLGLSVLTLYEFFIRYASNFDFVKDKCFFIEKNINLFYGYPQKDITFNNQMLNEIQKKSEEDFAAFINLIIEKRSLIEAERMYDFINCILKKYELSLLNYYSYEPKIDLSLLEEDFIKCIDPWTKEIKSFLPNLRTIFTMSAKQSLIDVYKEAANCNGYDVDKHCRNI